LKTVAIVEDNEDNRLIVKLLLEDRYLIQSFGDGPSALESFKTMKPDIVLMDISLPGMDGMDVLKQMRSLPYLAGIPVIALTAHAMRGDAEEYIAKGFDGYVSKPIIDENILISAIENLIS
jgi:CheY-like chemotaxis protein